MAAAPVYAAVPKIGFGEVSVLAGREGTGTIVELYDPPAAGSRLERIVIQATNDPADGIIFIFLWDGTDWELFDEFDMGNPAAASASLPAFRAEKAYSDIVLPDTWKLGAGISVAPTAGVVNVFAFLADLT